MKSVVKLVASLFGSAAGMGFVFAVIVIGGIPGMLSRQNLSLLGVMVMALAAIGGAWIGLLWGRSITKD